MKNLGLILLWLLVVGGLLWGYEGATNIDLLEQVLGQTMESLVDLVVGVSAFVTAFLLITGKISVKVKQK